MAANPHNQHKVNGKNNGGASTKRLRPITEEPDNRAAWDATGFDKDVFIVMHVQNAPEPIALPHNRENLLGRIDPSCGACPNIDLSPYNALEKGVSRIHAAIRRIDNTFSLVDLESINGTHLNGQRLVPNQSKLLHDGDEIRLGKLTMRVYSHSK